MPVWYARFLYHPLSSVPRIWLALLLIVLSVIAVACAAEPPPEPTPPPAGAAPPIAPKPPEPPRLTPDPLAAGNAPTVPATNPQDFISLLNQAVSLVTQRYPEAKLYEANGTAGGTSGGAAAESIQQWRFVFQNANNTSVMLNYAEGFFQAPQLLEQPWLEDRVIDLPLKRSLEDAVTLLKQNGYTDSFTNVTLRYPLYPGVAEPSYIFTIPARNSFVFVGVNTGQVTAQGQ